MVDSDILHLMVWIGAGAAPAGAAWAGYYFSIRFCFTQRVLKQVLPFTTSRSTP